MPRMTLVLLTLVIFTACEKNVQSPVRTYSKDFYYYNEKVIDSARNSATGDLYFTFNNKGKKTVFQWISSSDIPGANDAGYASALTFQADSGVTSFTYTNDELQQHLTHYYSYGAWTSTRHMLINKGYITGKKEGDFWKITIDVVLPAKDESAGIAAISESGTYIEVKQQ